MFGISLSSFPVAACNLPNVTPRNAPLQTNSTLNRSLVCVFSPLKTCQNLDKGNIPHWGLDRDPEGYQSRYLTFLSSIDPQPVNKCSGEQVFSAPRLSSTSRGPQGPPTSTSFQFSSLRDPVLPRESLNLHSLGPHGAPNWRVHILDSRSSDRPTTPAKRRKIRTSPRGDVQSLYTPAIH